MLLKQETSKNSDSRLKEQGNLKVRMILPKSLSLPTLGELRHCLWLVKGATWICRGVSEGNLVRPLFFSNLYTHRKSAYLSSESRHSFSGEWPIALLRETSYFSVESYVCQVSLPSQFSYSTHSCLSKPSVFVWSLIA